jgi:hypothetical protein
MPVPSGFPTAAGPLVLAILLGGCVASGPPDVESGAPQGPAADVTRLTETVAGRMSAF